MWVTVEQACKVRGSRASWYRWVKDGEVASKDEQGQLLVFVSKEANTPGLDLVVAELRELRVLVERLMPDYSRPTIEYPEATPAPRPAPEPCPEPARPVSAPTGSQTFQPFERIDHEGLLAALEAKREAEGLSDSEIQRRVGLVGGWLTKARKGERRGPKARRSWGRIAAYVAA